MLETTIGTEMIEEINEELNEDRRESTLIGGSSATRIESHRWQSGQLQLRVLWDTGQPTWEEFRLLKVDHPHMTATYIVDHNVTRSSTRQDSDRTLQWAKKTLRDISRAVRRIALLYDHHLDANDDGFRSRRAGVNGKSGKSKGPRNSSSTELKFRGPFHRRMNSIRRMGTHSGMTQLNWRSIL